MEYNSRLGAIEAINNEMEKKYKAINRKLGKLEGTQMSSYEHHRNFYPRVVNKTNTLLF